MSKRKTIHSTYGYGAHVIFLPDGTTIWHSEPFCMTNVRAA